MARPLKEGLDYWPRDVDLREDKKVKLIKAEFSLKGVYLFEEILNTAYRESGYFKKWDDDDCLLMSEGVGCGCTPELITEVLQGCLRRSLFDKRVFQMFGVLTSRGMQKRFLKIVTNNRDEIPIIKEYWLLNERDVPAGTLKKLTFFSVSLKDNPLNLKDNPLNLTDNTQRKEKESKVNKRKDVDQKEKTPAVPTAGNLVIELILNDGSFYQVLESTATQWVQLYPAVNVRQEFRNMKGWCDSNPAKRKAPHEINRFINNWLAKEQRLAEQRMVKEQDKGENEHGEHEAVDKRKYGIRL